MFRTLCFVLALPFGAVAANEGQATAFFREKVRPILVNQCFKCHSHEADKIKGGLVLDSREGVITGGDTGPAVVPGDPEKSLLIKAIRYDDADLQMPPNKAGGKKLPDASIAVLTEWVKLGVPWADEPKGQKMASRPRGAITDEDRKWWAVRPIAKPQPPQTDKNAWVVNDIDRFILQKLYAAGLLPAPRATSEQLCRRIYFDLIGLPPTPQESAAFVEASRRNPKTAVEKLVDSLLASPRYGERWARHWLDLVRYAESDGYRVDDYRPNAWRYRDYVIKSFNTDKPYDRFVQEQLAGDELWPDDPDALTATGFLCHGIYEYNNRDAVGQWTAMLNDITDTTADVFMGVGLQCARCHDHKFDPILQKDYFRLQAFFAPIRLYGEREAASPEQRAAQAETLAAWEKKTAKLRQELWELEKPFRDKAAHDATAKFPRETRAMINKPLAERTPREQQIVELAWRQVEYEWSDKRFAARVKEPAKSKRAGILEAINRFNSEKPALLPVVLTASDIGPVAPPVTIPKKPALGEIEPGFLSVLGDAPLKIEPRGHSTGRRSAFARWLTQPENPLTARVIVNRVWQYHFGTGLAVNTSDFGKLGEAPSHPELLDWLAVTFCESGWDVKKLVRLMLTSAAFRQSSVITPDLAKRDPENRLYARGPRFRLDAEQLRDNALFVSGLMNSEMGGRGVRPYQPPNIWEPVGFVGANSNTRVYTQDHGPALYRRSIYVFLKRTAPPPFVTNFDGPNREQFCAVRERSNTPLQALQLMNDVQHFEAARGFAEHIMTEGGATPVDRIAYAYRAVLSRKPGAEEAAVVQDAFTKFLAQFSQDTEAAKKTVHNGESKPKADLPEPELAAWTLVANLVLNLDETVTRN